MSNQNNPWALVLSGGGARGFAHIGFLKELEKSGFPRPSLVVGTSMGAIVGGLYACGMTTAPMERFVCEEFNITDYLESFTFRINGPVGKVFQTGQALASLATRPGMDTGQRVLELLEDLSGGKRFDETDIPFRCNAMDILTGREAVFSTGSVARAIRASMSFPVFFEPFEENGMYLVDGGLWDNMPVAIARKEGFKHTLAVNVNRFAPQELGDLRTGPQVIYRCIEGALNAMQNVKKVQAELTLDITDDATPFSFLRQREFIELGEQAVRRNLKTLEDFFESRFGFFRKHTVCS